MPVHVLIVDTNPGGAAGLEAGLVEAGFDVLMTVDEHDDLFARVKEQQPDAVIVDAEQPSRDMLERLDRLGRRYPGPMIILTQHEAPEITREAAGAGVSIYVVDGAPPAILRSLVQMAIEHSQAQRRLKDELSAAKRTFEERKAVDRAKCRVMERHGLGEDAAYRRLRKLAMDRRLSLSDLAQEVLRAGG